MVPLYSIIQDGHHNPFTCVALLPSSSGIQVTVVAVVLRMEKANNLDGIKLSDRHLSPDKNVLLTKSGKAYD